MNVLVNLLSINVNFVIFVQFTDWSRGPSSNITTFSIKSVRNRSNCSLCLSVTQTHTYTLTNALKTP